MNSRPFLLLSALAVVAWAASNLANATEQVVVAEPSSSNPPQQPQVAIDGGGVIHVAFGTKSGKTQGDVFYARSEDGGKSFSAPISVGSVSTLALGMRRGPRIAVSGDAVCISVISHKEGNIFLFRSTDQGKTWNQAATINDQRGSASEGLHAMSAGPKGELVCVWLDHRHKKSEVFSSTSTDGGKTWTKNVLAYRSPDGDVCPCCHPSVVYAPDGKIHIVWRNALGGSRDMYHAVSSDSGKSFAKAQKLGAGTWKLDSCPMDGGSIAILPSGKLATIWRRDKTVYYFGTGSSQEMELAPGEQPWLAASSKGLIIVWLRKRGESLVLGQPGAAIPMELSKAAGDPIVASGGPKNEIVVAAWEDSGGGDKKIVCQRIELAR